MRGAPFVGGKLPPDAACAPAGKRVLGKPGEKVGEPRAPVHADGRLFVQHKSRQCQTYESVENIMTARTDREAGSGTPPLRGGLGCLVVAAID